MYICIKQHVRMLYGVISRTVTVYICTELVLMFIINVYCIVLHGAKFSPSVLHTRAKLILNISIYTEPPT